MTDQQIAADIERGLFIREELGRLVAELKAIEKRLEAAGLKSPQVPLEDAEREGKQFLAQGAGKILPVRFESDQLIATFRPDTDLHATIAALLGDHLATFFKDTRVFERVHKDDANRFRKLARKTLEPDTFAKLISACISKTKDGIPKSKTVVAWDDVKPLDQATA